MDLKAKLFELEDINYKNFSSKLTKTKYPIIGVRIPILKQMAKEIKNIDVSFSNSVYFEEIMIEGLLIGYIKDIDKVIEKLKSFVCKIDDWSVCDSLCANLRITKKNKEKMWNFISGFKDSNDEFKLRFMIVMMMDYYIDEFYIDKIFEIIDKINCSFYYTNMAISWLLATSLAKLENKTLDYLNNCNLNNFVFNKTISKAIDSYRINENLKEKLKKMKKIG